jgi:release factor glutamine methyltransferase
MTQSLESLLQNASAAFAAGGFEGPRMEARALASGILGLAREAMVAHPEMEIVSGDIKKFKNAVDRRLAHEPVARIINEREFWSLSFSLGPDTLVPRPETETLIESVEAEIQDHDRTFSILDLGTGSGCLLLALLTEYPNAVGLGIDCAEGAIRIAETNAKALGLDGRARFQCGNWGDGLDGPFDLIVSNPPYIADGDRDHLAVDVREHDPDRALFAGLDGLDAYRAIAPQIYDLLGPSGICVIELGAGQGDAVRTIFEATGLVVRHSRADLAGIERALSLINPLEKGGVGPGGIKVKKKVGKAGIPV